MFDFWFDLPPIGRAIFSLVLIGIAVLLWYLTGGRLYVYGLAIVGVVLLFASGAGSNKGGYKF